MNLLTRFKKIPAIYRNKFMVCGLLFMGWLIFVDRNNTFTQVTLSSEERKLEDQKAFYKSEIDRARQDQYELLSSPEKLEKFAREQYRMKKEDEDLFIITEPKPKID
jgi:cell division protein DivIC